METEGSLTTAEGTRGDSKWAQEMFGGNGNILKSDGCVGCTAL